MRPAGPASGAAQPVREPPETRTKVLDQRPEFHTFDCVSSMKKRVSLTGIVNNRTVKTRNWDGKYSENARLMMAERKTSNEAINAPGLLLFPCELLRLFNDWSAAETWRPVDGSAHVHRRATTAGDANERSPTSSLPTGGWSPHLAWKVHGKRAPIG